MVEGDATVTGTEPRAYAAPAPDATLAPGTRIGRYEIERRIGAGGMGVVYAAQDLHLRRRVALKLVGPRIEHAFGQSHLVREAQAMATLRHPNLAVVHDIGVSDGQLFVVMELVDGGSAADWLRAKPRSWQDIVAIYVHAAHGLQAAHAAGFLHRDFKPENVLVGSDGIVRVTDFGVARLLGEADAAVAGTAGYIAPEILRGRPVDHRADQFSFCVALHASLHGCRPFASPETPREIRETLGARRPSPPHRVPHWVQRIVERGLAAEPDDRWPSMAALSAALVRGTTRPWRRRLAAIGLLAAAAIAAAVVITVRSGSTPPAAPLGPDWSPVAIGRDNEAAPSNIVVSRDGSTLATWTADQAWVEPRAGTGTRRRVGYPASSHAARCKLSLHGEQLVCALDVGSAAAEIWAIDVATGRGERRVPPAAAPELRPRGNFDVGADGSVVFTALDGDSAWRVDASGAVARVVVAAPGSKVSGFVSSPDATRLAFKVRSPAGSEVKILDRRTGAIATVSRRMCKDLEWLTDDSLVCAPLIYRKPVVIELRVRPGRAAVERVRYDGPEYQVLSSLSVSSAGVVLSTTPNDEHLAIVALDASGAVETLASGGISDLPAIGWTPSGALIFGANVRGRLRIMARRPDGTIDIVHTGTAAEVPLQLLGDAIVFGRFPGGETTIPFFEAPLGRRFPDGELFILDHPGAAPRSLGATRGFHALLCPRGQPTCLLAERTGGDVIAIDWDPRTGARGRQRARWALTDFPGESELSPDATTLAQVARFQGDGTVSLLDLATGQRHAVALGSWRSIDYPTWQPDGTLLAQAWRQDAVRSIVRIRAGDVIEELAKLPDVAAEDVFRVSDDGTTAAMLTAKLVQTHWWVANAPGARVP